MGDNNGDHYSILGLDQTCSTDELRQAYKKLALQYHPDRPKTGDEEKFRAIERAYKVLSDPESRTDYDIHLDNSARLDHPVWQVVALDELILQDELHTMECRCGGTMRLDSQLASGQLPIIIQCEDCSTYVRVNPAE